jgi:hypothetical protein
MDTHSEPHSPHLWCGLKKNNSLNNEMILTVKFKVLGGLCDPFANAEQLLYKIKVV